MSDCFSLTRRQQQALDAIRRHMAQHGSAPSFQELADALNIKSKGSVHLMLDSLERRGHIRRLRRANRAIALVEPGAPEPALPPAVQANLDAYCRLHGEEPACVVADAVALFLDQREADTLRQAAGGGD